MRTWHVHGVHRLTWVVLFLLVLALAIFAMAAGFRQLRSRLVPAAPESGDRGSLPAALLVTGNAFLTDAASV
jgi:hypothetical protein